MNSEILTGKGWFHFGEQSIESEFRIIFYPRQTFIEINAIPIDGFFIDPWALKELLADGTKVESDNLIATGVGDNELYVNEILTGEKTNVANISSYPLVGFYGPNFSINYRGYEVAVTDEKDIDEEKRIYRRTGVIREGVHLKLTKQHHLIQDSLDLATALTILLTVATGNDVIFNKRIYDNKYIVHRRSIIESSGFDNVIPHKWMGRYLAVSIQVWNNLQEKDQKLIKNLASYLNFAGGADYLDERMFRVAQG